MSRGDIMEEIKRALMKCGALLLGEFTLASGKKSTYYIDIKRAITDPSILSIIADKIVSLISKNGIRFDKIAGVVVGSIPLAVAVSLKTGIPYVMVRKERKDHGTGKMIEGIVEKGERIIIIEDVVTSGVSASEAATILRNAGAIVDYVIAIVDREEGAKDFLKSINIELIPLLKSMDLLG